MDIERVKTMKHFLPILTLATLLLVGCDKVSDDVRPPRTIEVPVMAGRNTIVNPLELTGQVASDMRVITGPLHGNTDLVAENGFLIYTPNHDLEQGEDLVTVTMTNAEGEEEVINLRFDVNDHACGDDMTFEEIVLHDGHGLNDILSHLGNCGLPSNINSMSMAYHQIAGPGNFVSFFAGQNGQVYLQFQNPDNLVPGRMEFVMEMGLNSPGGERFIDGRLNPEAFDIYSLSHLVIEITD